MIMVKEKTKLYEQLTGNAKEAGEDIAELIKFAEREEAWRNRGIELRDCNT